MENREAREVIEALRDLMYTTQDYPLLGDLTMYCEALTLAISALEQQEQVNTQSVNLTHTTHPNALESLKILESAKDENGCVPMSLVRLAFRNVLEQDRWVQVTERLPEYGTVVLTQLSDNDIVTNLVIDEEDEEWFEDDVIAWRPLPELFQEEE